MNRRNLYHRTESFLKDAYRAKLIRYRNCCHCPVAHLITRNMNYKVRWGGWYNGKVEINAMNWHTFIRCHTLRDKFKFIKRYGLHQYLLHKLYVFETGYTAAELVRIENAFENCYDKVDVPIDNRDVLKGLKAVFEELKDIHKITSEDFSVNKRRVRNNSSDDIIDRMVNRYEALSWNEQ